MSEEKMGGMKGGDMLKGLSRKSPPAEDSSMRPKGGRVDNEATRTSTAPTPKTLGPRCA